MTALHIDLETRSAVDLRDVGVHRYAEDPTTSIVLGSYAFDDGPVRRFRGPGVPQEVKAHIAAGGRMKGHGQQFERIMLRAAGVPVTLEQQDCTLARAAAVSLPQSLEGVGMALDVEERKDEVGRRLMLQMCKPRTREPLTWWDDEERMNRLAAYCDRDVAAERAVEAKLPQLSERERRVWRLDQTINDRGFAVDLSLVRRANAAVNEALRRANLSIFKLTDGAVSAVTQVQRIVKWINARGVPCESIAEGEYEGLLIGDELFDANIMPVVNLRQASAKAFKYPSMEAAACRDGRIRGSLAYHAAHSGRWAGRVVQPHNMKRVETEEDEQTVALTIQILQRASSAVDAVDQLEMIVGDVLEALSLCTRAMIVASPGRYLIGGDFSNIEGRLNAWFAGETWKLQAFRDYDADIGPDLYKVTASRILEKDFNVIAKEDRQIWGKVPELACGYQGGLGAFKRMGAKYGVRLPNTKIHQIVQGWRAQNGRIVDSWKELEQAGLDAVSAPGCIMSCLNGKVRYVVDHGFLFCQLPSNRVIAYASPSIEWKRKIVTIDDEEVEIAKYGVSYWGEKKGWRKLDLYGGSQCAHVVSGMARDLLVEGMFAVEDAGYPIVLTVHDEILAEPQDGFGARQDFAARMAEAARAMAPGLPVSVKAWEGLRYDK